MVLHALWCCGVARDVWANSHRWIQKCGGGHVDFVQLIEELMDKLAVEELELFLVQCWVIWSQRNSVIHGGVLQEPSRLVNRATDLLEEYRRAQELLAIHSNIGLVQKWEPSVGLIYKVNFDAAVFADLDALGVGVVVRNDKGEVMASLSTKGPPVQDSEEAEALACRRAMEFAVEVGFLEVILEGDNVTVMKSLISLKPNSANSVAHALAKHASEVDDELVWLEDCPQPASEALYFGSLGLS
uniref:RNase H type-1 domain-containing protein n=1 Tax=Quercus lobata TaxID=97700 RepID=A0A7N2LRV2_QUELO